MLPYGFTEISLTFTNFQDLLQTLILLKETYESIINTLIKETCQEGNQEYINTL